MFMRTNDTKNFLQIFIFKFLKKFTTEQGKIIPAHVTGVSARYQRMLTREIKKARNIALLPYANDPRKN